MSDGLIIYLQRDLDWVRLHGMPSWTKERIYPLKAPPRKDRYQAGEVLVWSQKSNERPAYVGVLIGGQVAEDGLTFEWFERFLWTVDVDSHRAPYCDPNKPFLYLPRTMFDVAVKRGRGFEEEDLVDELFVGIEQWFDEGHREYEVDTSRLKGHGDLIPDLIWQAVVVRALSVGWTASIDGPIVRIRHPNPR